MMLLEQVSNGILIGAVYSLVGVGFTLIFGIVRVLNFAYGEFFMLAAYLTFFLFSGLGLPFWLVVALNAAALFAFGMLAERALIKPLRSKPDAYAAIIIATLGLQVVLQNGALLVFGGNYRSIVGYVHGVFDLGGMLVSYERLVIFFGSVLMLGLTYWLVNRTWLGRSMRAVSQNADAAVLCGVNINRVYALSFGLSAALVAVAGALLVPVYHVFPTVGQNPMMKAFAVTLLGGLGNIEGAMLSGFILGVAESLAGGYISSLARDGVAFAFMIVILIVYPSGIGSLLQRLGGRRGTDV